MSNLIRHVVAFMRVGQRTLPPRLPAARRAPIEIGMCALRGCERPTFNKALCEIHFDPRQRETS